MTSERKIEAQIAAQVRAEQLKHSPELVKTLFARKDALRTAARALHDEIVRLPRGSSERAAAKLTRDGLVAQIKRIDQELTSRYL